MLTAKACLQGLRSLLNSIHSAFIWLLLFLSPKTGELPVAYGSNASPVLQKLHDLRALSRQLRPARARRGILLQSSDRLPRDFKIHLSQLTFRCPPHWKGVVSDAHTF